MSYTAALPHAGVREGGDMRLARWVVLGALTFNLVLAFVNASVTGIGAAHVIAAELLLTATAFALIWNRGEVFYVIALPLGCWLIFAMVMRGGIDAKVLRDAFIPVVFYFLGRYRGSPASGDRLVTTAVIVVAAGALIEWAFLDLYIQYVDVLGYYIARGSVEAGDGTGGPGLFISGIRFDGRTLLAFLGEHRVSSVFLEPVSLGNFGAIAFAWVLLRDHARPWTLIGKTLLILMILVLGDARFGIYLCAVTALIYVAAPLLRPALVFVLPYAAIAGLLAYAGSMGDVPWDNTTTGRFLLSGQLLATLGIGQALGLETTGVNFVDSGYATMLAQFGLPGATGLWALYVLGSPAETREAWRFKLFVAFYLILLLSISTSSLTIKTAALLWFLAGCMTPGRRAAPAVWTAR